MKVKLTYFKPSGKYYAGGEYETHCQYMYQIFEEAKDMVEARKLPGLVDGATGYHVLIECPDHPQGYPGLLPSKEAQL